MKREGKKGAALAIAGGGRAGRVVAEGRSLTGCAGPGVRNRGWSLLERIALAPRQSLALVEAEGRRFLVATSAEGGPAFYPLESRGAARRRRRHRGSHGSPVGRGAGGSRTFVARP